MITILTKRFRFNFQVSDKMLDTFENFNGKHDNGHGRNIKFLNIFLARHPILSNSWNNKKNLCEAEGFV